MVPLGEEAQWKLVSARLETVLILTQDRCMVCVEHIIGSEIILHHPMEFLGDVGHVEPHLFPYGDSVSVSATLVHGLHQTYHQLRNRFGRTRWYS